MTINAIDKPENSLRTVDIAMRTMIFCFVVAEARIKTFKWTIIYDVAAPSSRTTSVAIEQDESTVDTRRVLAKARESDLPFSIHLQKLLLTLRERAERDDLGDDVDRPDFSN